MLSILFPNLAFIYSSKNNIFKYVFYYFCVCLCQWRACVYTCRGQTRALDLLELDVQVVDNHWIQGLRTALGFFGSGLNCWSISPDHWAGFLWSYEWSPGPRYVSFFPRWESIVCLISQLSLCNQVQIGYHGWTFLTVSETVAVAAAYSLHCIVYCKQIIA